MRKVVVMSAVMLAGWLGSAAPARAQGALVQGTVFAATSEEDTTFGFSGAAGYRFNRVFGLGVELTQLPDFAPRFDRIEALQGLDIETSGHATMFTTNVRIEIPTVSDRIIPYVVGGGGVASVNREIEVNYNRPGMPNLPPGMVLPPGIVLPPGLGNLRPILPGGDMESNRTNMVLQLGGGASFLLSDHISIDADLRFMTIFGDRDNNNIGRFGAGVSYRF